MTDPMFANLRATALQSILMTGVIISFGAPAAAGGVRDDAARKAIEKGTRDTGNTVEKGAHDAEPTIEKSHPFAVQGGPPVEIRPRHAMHHR